MSTPDIPLGTLVEATAGTSTVRGIVRFCGETLFARGIWVGMELSEPRGKNDGSVAGTRYFECGINCGIFVKFNQVKLEGAAGPSTGLSTLLGSPPLPPSFPAHQTEIPFPITPQVAEYESSPSSPLAANAAHSKEQEPRVKIRDLEAPYTDDQQQIRILMSYIDGLEALTLWKPSLLAKLSQLQQENLQMRREMQIQAEKLQLAEIKSKGCSEHLEMAILDKEAAEDRAEVAEQLLDELKLRESNRTTSGEALEVDLARPQCLHYHHKITGFSHPMATQCDSSASDNAVETVPLGMSSPTSSSWSLVTDEELVSFPPSPASESDPQSANSNSVQHPMAEDPILARELQLSALDVQVKAAQDHYESLISLRADLQMQIYRDKNRLQPALSLPRRILGEIFAYCVSNDAYALWKLTSVCFDWRTVGLFYPHLWCRIIIPSHLSPPDQVRVTELWIERTGTAKCLDIQYRAVDETVRYSTRTFEEIMAFLASHLPRWQHFDLETNLDDCVHMYMRLCVGPAPNLETFSIRVPGPPTISRNRRLIPCRTIALGPAPRLKHVVLHTSAWPTANLLTGLTTLTLIANRAKRISDLWNVLDACSGLERLILQLPVDPEFDPAARSRTTALRMDHLHSLSGDAVILAILPHLHLPSLKTLQVNNVEAHELARTLNVLNLRSNPPLHTLRLQNCRLVSGTAGLSLKSIKRLEFYDSEVDDTFFLSLSMPTACTSSWIRSHRTWALPSLEVVILCRAHYVREESLRRLVEARNSEGTPAAGLPARIKTVDVKDCRLISPQFADWLQERLAQVSDRFPVEQANSTTSWVRRPVVGPRAVHVLPRPPPSMRSNMTQQDMIDQGNDILVRTLFG